MTSFLPSQEMFFPSHRIPFPWRFFRRHAFAVCAGLDEAEEWGQPLNRDKKLQLLVTIQGLTPLLPPVGRTTGKKARRRGCGAPVFIPPEEGQTGVCGSSPCEDRKKGLSYAGNEILGE